MATEAQHEVKIGVAPYEDSGFAAVVTADDRPDIGPGFRIEMVYRLTPDQWPELRSAVERALALIAPSPQGERP